MRIERKQLERLRACERRSISAGSWPPPLQPANAQPLNNRNPARNLEAN
jgi:hypothetical protein